jgi:hypothetical protein
MPNGSCQTAPAISEPLSRCPLVSTSCTINRHPFLSSIYGCKVPDDNDNPSQIYLQPIKLPRQPTPDPRLEPVQQMQTAAAIYFSLVAVQIGIFV